MTTLSVNADSAPSVAARCNDSQGVARFAGFLDGVESGRTFSAYDVDPVQYRFQVSWIYAVPHPAQVIEFFSFRDGTYGQLPTDAVSAEETRFLSVDAEPQQSVSLVVDHSGPDPMVAGLLDLGPELLFQGQASWPRHGDIVTMMGSMA